MTPDASHVLRSLDLPSDRTLERHELGRLAPQLLSYLLSFLTLGIFWVGQQTQLNQLARSNRDLTWIYLGFLLAVSLMPFSTGLLAEFITFRLALGLYWLNLLLLGVLLFCSRRYGVRAGLVRDDVTAEMLAAGERRIVVYQALYAFCLLIGMLSTYAAIALLVLLQLNSAVAPRIRPLDRF